MIDLKKEIEVKLKYAKNLYDNINENDNGYLKSYFLGTIQSYETILKCLENHNIITAPKTIKLSEIVSRLKETIKEEFSMEDGYRCEKAIGYYTRCFEDSDFIEIVGFDRDMKITRVGVCYEGFEWLYTLWITRTIIEDDLKRCDNND